MRKTSFLSTSRSHAPAWGRQCGFLYALPHWSMGTSIVVLILLLLPVMAFSQRAFDIHGQFVTTSDYEVKDIKAAPLGDDQTLLVWSQKDLRGLEIVWAHIIDAEGNLVNGDDPLVLSNSDISSHLRDAMPLEDGTVIVLWEGGDRSPRVQKILPDGEFAWGAHGMTSEDFNVGYFPPCLLPNEQNGFYVINHENDNASFMSFDENGNLVDGWEEALAIWEEFSLGLGTDYHGSIWTFSPAPDYGEGGVNPWINKVLSDRSLLFEQNLEIQLPDEDIDGYYSAIKFALSGELYMLFTIDNQNFSSSLVRLSEDGEYVAHYNIEQPIQDYFINASGEHPSIYYTWDDRDAWTTYLDRLDTEHPNDRPWQHPLTIFEPVEAHQGYEIERIYFNGDYLTILGKETQTDDGTPGTETDYEALRFDYEGNPVWEQQPKDVLHTYPFLPEVLCSVCTAEGNLSLTTVQINAEEFRFIDVFTGEVEFGGIDSEGEPLSDQLPLNISLGDYGDLTNFQTAISADDACNAFWYDDRRGLIAQKITTDGELMYHLEGQLLVERESILPNWNVREFNDLILFNHWQHLPGEDDEIISQTIAYDADHNETWEISFRFGDYAGVPKLVYQMDNRLIYCARTGEAEDRQFRFSAWSSEQAELWRFDFDPQAANPDLLKIEFLMDNEVYVIITSDLEIAAVNRWGEVDWSFTLEHEFPVDILATRPVDGAYEVFYSEKLSDHDIYCTIHRILINRGGEVVEDEEIHPFAHRHPLFSHLDLFPNPDGSIWLKDNQNFQFINTEDRRPLGVEGYTFERHISSNMIQPDGQGGCWLLGEIGLENQLKGVKANHFDANGNLAREEWTARGQSVFRALNNHYRSLQDIHLNPRNQTLYVSALTTYIEITDMGMYRSVPVDYRVQLLDEELLWIGEDAARPDDFMLVEAFPNPFNSSINISFTIPQPGAVTVSIRDTQGRQIAEVLASSLNAGSHTVSWEAAGISSGIYFCEVFCAGEVRVGKVVLVR